MSKWIRRGAAPLAVSICLLAVASNAVLSTNDLKRRKTAEQSPDEIKGNGKQALVPFTDRIEFFELTDTLQLDPKVQYSRKFIKSGVKISAMDIQPSAILWLGQMADVVGNPGENLLVCQPDFAAITSQKGLAGFCGVVSWGGKIIFSFPIKQQTPNRVLFPLGITEHGKYAEVCLSTVEEQGDSYEASHPIAVYSWHYPNRFKKIGGPWKASEHHQADEFLKKWGFGK